MNIYVGYLPESYTDEQLRLKFTKFGKVASAKIIKDFETGKSRGFGFVQMRDDYEAQYAIDNLREWEEEGKKIVVNRAREKKSNNERNFAGKW